MTAAETGLATAKRRAEAAPPRPGPLTAWPAQALLGVPVNALTMDQVVSIVDETIARRPQAGLPGRLLIGVVNAAKVVNMSRDETLREAVLAANMILADGMSVVWAARVLHRRGGAGGQTCVRVPERVPGIDLMDHILKRGSERGYRVYFLGAEEEVLETAIARTLADHPGIVVAGRRNGYFTTEEEPGIAEDIRASRADILLAAMSSPKKEVFLARWSQELNVPVCHGVGGAFDVVAGKVQRAPAMWQRLGLEWLYRVVQEPRRMWRRYLVTNTLFCAMVVADLFRARARVRGSRSTR